MVIGCLDVPRAIMSNPLLGDGPWLRRWATWRPGKNDTFCNRPAGRRNCREGGDIDYGDTSAGASSTRAATGRQRRVSMAMTMSSNYPAATEAASDARPAEADAVHWRDIIAQIGSEI